MGWCTAQCEMLLLCAKTIAKEPIWRRKKEEGKAFWPFVGFYVLYFTVLFHALGVMKA